MCFRVILSCSVRVVVGEGIRLPKAVQDPVSSPGCGHPGAPSQRDMVTGRRPFWLSPFFLCWDAFLIQLMSLSHLTEVGELPQGTWHPCGFGASLINSGNFCSEGEEEF